MTTAVKEIRRRLALLLGRPVGTVHRLGEGVDNVTYEVEGELVVRISKDPDATRRSDHVSREVALLEVVTTISPLPVPEVVVVDTEAGMYGYHLMPGTPLLDHRLADPTVLAPALGGFLTALHRAPLPMMESLAPYDDDPLEEYLVDTTHAYEQAAAAVPDHHRPTVEAFLALPPPPGPAAAVFSHNDLGAEHILADVTSGTISGVIDWSDAAITDPAYDLGLILRDFGPPVLNQVLRHYGASFGPSDRERAVFYARCAVLEDLAYGLTTGDRRYADAALDHLDWTFGPVTAAQ